MTQQTRRIIIDIGLVLLFATGIVIGAGKKQPPDPLAALTARVAQLEAASFVYHQSFSTFQEIIDEYDAKLENLNHRLKSVESQLRVVAKGN